MKRCAALFLAPALLAGAAEAGTEYRVRVSGEVEFNGVSSGPLALVSAGDAVELSFVLDEDVFVDSASFPTRGYAIDPATWSLAFPAGSAPLQSPFPGTPFFVLRDDDPAVDGFFVSTSVDFPLGVPLAVSGGFGPFSNDFSVTYGGDLLSSVDLAGAVGTYDFDGLTVFHWTIDDGPFNAIGMVFERITIAEAVDPAVVPVGCLGNPAGSLTVLGGAARIGEVLELGVDNPLGTQGAGSAAFVVAGTQSFPCGLVQLPGFGMAGPGAAGELVVVPTGLVSFAGGAWAGPGQPAPVPVAIPILPALVGATAYLQGLLFDPLATSGVEWGLTTALAATIGS